MKWFVIFFAVMSTVSICIAKTRVIDPEGNKAQQELRVDIGYGYVLFHNVTDPAKIDAIIDHQVILGMTYAECIAALSFVESGIREPVRIVQKDLHQHQFIAKFLYGATDAATKIFVEFDRNRVVAFERWEQDWLKKPDEYTEPPFELIRSGGEFTMMELVK